MQHKSQLPNPITKGYIDMKKPLIILSAAIILLIVFMIGILTAARDDDPKADGTSLDTSGPTPLSSIDRGLRVIQSIHAKVEEKRLSGRIELVSGHII